MFETRRRPQIDLLTSGLCPCKVPPLQPPISKQKPRNEGFSLRRKGLVCCRQTGSVGRSLDRRLNFVVYASYVKAAMMREGSLEFGWFK